MIFIAHRGNTEGPNPLENHPDYIKKALSKGYNVEVDVRYLSGKFYLGHDTPDYEIDEAFIENERIWVHAKNFKALDHLLKNPKIHVFSHNVDPYVLTSKGYIFTFPSNASEYSEKSVCVMPELIEGHIDYSICYAVCSDYVPKLDEKLH